jgi:hypothetical protein
MRAGQVNVGHEDKVKHAVSMQRNGVLRSGSGESEIEYSE